MVTKKNLWEKNYVIIKNLMFFNNTTIFIADRVEGGARTQKYYLLRSSLNLLILKCVI